MAIVNRLGESFVWGDVKVVLFNVPVFGITEISYSAKREYKSNYGAGYEPVSVGKGNKTYEGSITLDMKELRAIMAAVSGQLAGGDITDFPPFNIKVVVSNDETNETFVDILHQCRFKSMGVATKQGDMAMNYQIPLHVSGITFAI